LGAVINACKKDKKAGGHEQGKPDSQNHGTGLKETTLLQGRFRAFFASIYLLTEKQCIHFPHYNYLMEMVFALALIFSSLFVVQARFSGEKHGCHEIDNRCNGQNRRKPEGN